MTTDLALSALKQWIESRYLTYPAIDDIPIHLRDTEDEKPGLLIVINDEGSDPHPVLHGVLTIDATCELFSVPGADADGDMSEESHQALVADLYNILADRNSIAWCDALAGIRVFDIRDVRMTTEAEDQMRVTRFDLRITACPA